VASQPNLEMMSVDELWSLHEEICSILSTRIDAEMRVLERRLFQLNGHVEKKTARSSDAIKGMASS
jgi:DNA-binding protein H-NS